MSKIFTRKKYALKKPLRFGFLHSFAPGRPIAQMPRCRNGACLAGRQVRQGVLYTFIFLLTFAAPMPRPQNTQMPERGPARVITHFHISPSQPTMLRGL
jgi:hypothetical protein